MRPIVFFLIAGLTLFSISCDSAEKAPVFTGDDIISFNLVTKKIIFTDAAEKNITYYRDSHKPIKMPFFKSPIYVVSIYSSYPHNDLVLYFNDDFNYYLYDANPPEVPDVWTNADEIRKIREKNAKKRENDWNKFINYLNETGKIVK